MNVHQPTAININTPNASALGTGISAQFRKVHSGNTQVIPHPYPQNAQFDNRLAIVGISLGNHNQEQHKLEAILEWASQHFEQMNIIVFDTLYRHNYLMANADNMERAFEMARRRGADWKYEQETILQKYEGQITHIKNWEEFRNDPRFTERMVTLTELANSDKNFQSYLAANIEEYMSRANRESMDEAALEKTHKRGRLFIMEELAGYSIIADKLKGAVRIYPSTVMATFRYFKDFTPPTGFESLAELPHVHLQLRGRKKSNGASPELNTGM